MLCFMPFTTYIQATESASYTLGDSLSSAFLALKGHLPSPVSGGCSVRRDSLTLSRGVDFRAGPGAVARTVAGGTVTAVFSYRGLQNILVRHGSYISVYCNLDSVLVGQGTAVESGQPLGPVHTVGGQSVLHFQLRHEKLPLDPFLWLAPTMKGAAVKKE